MFRVQKLLFLFHLQMVLQCNDGNWSLVVWSCIHNFPHRCRMGFELRGTKKLQTKVNIIIKMDNWMKKNSIIPACHHPPSSLHVSSYTEQHEWPPLSNEAIDEYTALQHGIHPWSGTPDYEPYATTVQQLPYLGSTSQILLPAGANHLHQFLIGKLITSDSKILLAILFVVVVGVIVSLVLIVMSISHIIPADLILHITELGALHRLSSI